MSHLDPVCAPAEAARRMSSKERGQPSLFGQPGAVPYQCGSRTSRTAAERITRAGTRAPKLRRLLEAYRAAGEHGLTGSEVEQATGLPIQSVCSLRWSARKKGWLLPCGERPGPFVTEQMVDRLTMAGAVVLALETK